MCYWNSFLYRDLLRMVESLPVFDTAGYILSSALTIVVYDVVTHLDEEIDYLVRSRSISIKGIFIMCRYLPIIIGAMRIPINVVGVSIDDEMRLTSMCSSIWLSLVQMTCVEFIFLLRTYALWGCSKRVLCFLLAVYLVACVTDVTSLQRYTEYLIAEVSYGLTNPDMSWLLACFVGLITVEMGLFGMTMYRVLSQYRATSGKLLNMLVRHNIVYFAASVALNALNIVGMLLAPIESKWPIDVMEIVQILFQGLLATRMQLDLWKIDCRTVESTMVTISMEEFAVMRPDSTINQNPHVATSNC
ncbi:uncharacterized protein EDB91DRAFT_734247 [Suillus paluster]|uniref:uncharacterized protein n=1 Tax=Suillus paluster TaxID=48578 RepID=UPI001B87E987|nr:uncharacterized protein EDB91DRAFT_734247 [Suillus paluster]KAG1731076.1 hypothetical protein EDB91DRAFT_734247 [Suillus paluster]